MSVSAPEDNSVGEAESESETSSVLHNGSVVSTVPDRHGFLGGAQYTQEGEQQIPVEVLRRRELKWLEMLGSWERYMAKKYKKVRERCRKGIPPSMRARAWQYLCGGRLLMEQNRHFFHELLTQPGDPHCVEDIKKDLHRQFPMHEMFMDKGGHGQEDLFRVLKAYSVLNPEDGYCQAHAPIAALFLMHMPAEQAFWCLVSVCDRYLPGYYSKSMEAIQVDGDILFGLCKKVCPSAYKHLKKQKMEPILYMTEWFLCVFTRTLPWATVLRVWDMFLCEGVKVMFRVALMLIKCTLGRHDVLKKCPSMYETLEVLRNLPQEILQPDYMVYQMMRLDLTEEDMKREHQKQVSKRRASSENSKRGKAR